MDGPTKLGIGIALILGLGGGAAVLNPEWRWVGSGMMAFSLLGLVGLALHHWWDAVRNAGRPVLWIGVAVCGTGLLAFSGWHFWLREDAAKPGHSDLGLVAIVVDAPYQADTKISGILWRPEYTALQIEILNQTYEKISDLDMIVKPDALVASITNISQVPTVIQEQFGFVPKMVIRKPDGTSVAYDASVVANSAGYRVHADSLPPRTSITLMVATVLIDPASIGLGNIPPGQTVGDMTNQVAESKLGEVSYWIGFDKGRHFMSGAKPRLVNFDGQYTVAGKRTKIARTLPVMGIVTAGHPGG
jgi:hypothetical protein